MSKRISETKPADLSFDEAGNPTVVPPWEHDGPDYDLSAIIRYLKSKGKTLDDLKTLSEEELERFRTR